MYIMRCDGMTVRWWDCGALMEAMGRAQEHMAMWSHKTSATVYEVDDPDAEERDWRMAGMLIRDDPSIPSMIRIIVGQSKPVAEQAREPAPSLPAVRRLRFRKHAT